MMGIISIHVDDLLISRPGTFLDYITFRTKGAFEADALGGSKATFLGMKIGKD